MLTTCLLGATFTTPVGNRVTLWLQQQFSLVNLHSEYFSYLLMQHQPYLYKTTKWKLQMKEWSWSVALRPAFSRPLGNESLVWSMSATGWGRQKPWCWELSWCREGPLQIQDPSKPPGLLRAVSADGMAGSASGQGDGGEPQHSSTHTYALEVQGGLAETLTLVSEAAHGIYQCHHCFQKTPKPLINSTW